MDYFTIGGLGAIALVAALLGLRIARDEKLLRRKMMVGQQL